MGRGGIGNGNFVRGVGQSHRGASRGGGARGNWRGRGNFRGGRGRGRGRGGANTNGVQLTTVDGTQAEAAQEDDEARDLLDERLGFTKYQEGAAKIGWLVNMHATLQRDESHPDGRAAVEYYFIEQDGSLFKSTLYYEPYMYLVCKKGNESQVEEWLLKRFEGTILRVERHSKEDLKMPNHLLGYKRTVIQIYFRNMNDFYLVRREVLPIVLKNQEKLDAVDAYAEIVDNSAAAMDIDFTGADMFADEDESIAKPTQSARLGGSSHQQASDLLIDIREYDVNYCLRVAIDKGESIAIQIQAKLEDVRCGLWYTVTADAGNVTFDCIRDRVERNDPVVFAFDIETTKAPLKFPESSHDQIMMISYMVDGQGYLVTNRSIVSADIDDFEYTPKPEYEGPFVIFNEKDESALLRRFFDHFRELKPTVVATYNGDYFDFPFVEARALANGMNMHQEIGFSKNTEGDYSSRTCAHMDAFKWVKRDSYLPQGSQGLKAVTTAKLGYNPDELDPELMTPYAIEQPHILAQYSVSDAVATYYLYMKYVHPFIFSLCNIIPLNPDEVLRKGSGTLCETLLMVEAYNGQILMPNRHVEEHGNMFEGHLLESETYVGGHVEALEAGIFRNDIATDFKIAPAAVQKLIDDLDDALKFAIIQEHQKSLDDILNYDEVKDSIEALLVDLRDNPVRLDKPLIYHLDVAAMYPNIMLSNRLQPDSVVSEAMCAACDYNRPDKSCDKRMTWAWRGEFFPAKMDEYKMVRNALENEQFPSKWPNGPQRRFVDLTPAEQTSLLHKRLGDYSRKVYKRTHDTKVVNKDSIICQRENPFYIDTVRAFRDRRYIYKGLHKDWKRNLDNATNLTESTEAKKMIVLYDSLQLAHKCILNSFYGYVMRKGARWHSMEMAGITCLTGAKIIQMAKDIVDDIGRPLELDTDGIWCMLPATFPDNFSLKTTSGKAIPLSYPCSMLNHLVHAQFTNTQYHELTDPERGTYSIRSENSIFFELDGPYRAMILPSSKEEDKLLKKRYAVFNEDGSLAELKGFEVKRRGELQLIKIFQTSIFERFLEGDTLIDCYASVAEIADQWLNVLQSKGESLPDEELVELIAENRSMSKTLAEYAGQKSTSISTAKRLAEFLGEQMVKDKGLACKFIISHKPIGAPVTERAIPVAIFTAEPAVRKHFLCKWLKDNGLTSFELRDVLDWSYYIERLGSVIQKLITIPAALQKVPNPVPRIPHPDWLSRRVANLDDKFKQRRVTDMFQKQQTVNDERREAGNPVVDHAAEKKEMEKVAKDKAAAKAKLQAEEDARRPVPKIDEDYPAWVAHMKKVWKVRRKEREALRARGAFVSRSKTGAIGSMLRQNTFSLASLSWDVVQISEVSERPGEFKLFLLIKDTIQSVRLHVPRQFYVDLKEIKDREWPTGCVVEAISRTLPRSQRSHNLFRVTTSEDLYLREEAAFSQLINQPEVDGVYELQVPLLVRAILQLGNTVIPGSGIGLNKGLDKGFQMSDLSRPEMSLSKRRYLDGGRPLKYAYLYHATADTRHMIGLFLPTGNARVFVVERGNNRDMPNLERYYKEQRPVVLQKLAASEPASRVFEYPTEVKFEITFHGNEDIAFRAVSRELISYNGQKHGPTVLGIYSSKERSFFEEKMAVACAQFPVLMRVARASDNAFNALGWRVPATKRMVQHYLRFSSVVREQIETSDAAGIPLCNLEADESLFCTDIDLARRLQKADMLLWWSPNARPDVGGRETDNAVSSGEKAAPEVSRAGCYTSACLEVDMRDLVVDAVMQSALVYELEGAEGASVGFKEASHNLDEYAKGTAHADVVLGDIILPVHTFNLVKNMVREWWAQSAKEGHCARKLLDHFWRWVSSPTSRLYDPAIFQFIEGLMRKTFSQLIAEFRRLGSEIIYGDFGKLWLLTSKPSSAMAYAYSNYVVSAVNSRDLFKYISLTITGRWDILLWMDIANFGGVACRDALQETIPGKEGSEIDMNWNIASFLPDAVRPAFQEATALFVHGLHVCNYESRESQRTPLRVMQNTMQTQVVPEKRKEHDLAGEFIAHKLTRQLLKVIQDLQRRQAEDAPFTDARETWEFPNLPGSYLRFDNPILELVKSTCAVLGLSRDLVSEVGVLRRNLLEIIGQKEFAPSAMFKNPAMPFRVDMVCSSCTASRRFDLTRDADLLGELPPGVRKRVFSCAKCKHPYDNASIEAKLVEIITRRFNSYQLSDLSCGRCKQIKSNSLSVHCECSGVFQPVESRVELAKTLVVVGNVAEFYGFRALGDVTAMLKGQ